MSNFLIRTNIFTPLNRELVNTRICRPPEVNSNGSFVKNHNI